MSGLVWSDQQEDETQAGEDEGTRIAVRALAFVIGVLFFNVLLVSTVGRIHGCLRPAAIAGGALQVVATVIAIGVFIRLLKRELGARWLAVFWVAFLPQVFWAFFKAPLDGDGLGYHLPIILESLQRNQWGIWSFLDWRIQTFPKFGEILNLGLIAVGGPYGYRLSQFGQFAPIFAGVLASVVIARCCRLPRPALFGLLFLLTPIVIKQMGSHHVDATAWSFWLSIAACMLASRPWQGSRASVRWNPWACWFFAGAALFLHAGIKSSGALTGAALAPVLLGVFLQSENKKRQLAQIAVFVGLGLAGVLSWVIPNWIHWGNPIYPIDLFGGIVKPELVGVGVDYHAILRYSPLPAFLRWASQLLLHEAIAVYDLNDGAWGPVGAWALLFWVYWVFRMIPGIRPASWRQLSHGAGARLRDAIRNPALLLELSMLLAFLLMPSRIVPRHGLLGGFVLIVPAVTLLLRGKLSRGWRIAFQVAIILQLAYVLGDRVLLRGAKLSQPLQAASVVLENFRDVVVSGEPQHPDRWMHFPYVPVLRKDEPRHVIVGKDVIDLKGVYWGRKFTNQVDVDWSFCFEKTSWPFICTPAGLKPMPRELLIKPFVNNN